MPLPKECIDCGRKFNPNSYANKKCDKCRDKISTLNGKKLRKEWRLAHISHKIKVKKQRFEYV